MVYQLEEHVDWFSTECWSISRRLRVLPKMLFEYCPIQWTNTQPIVLVDTWLTGVLSKHDPYILPTETKHSVGNQRSCPIKNLLFVYFIAETQEAFLPLPMPLLMPFHPSSKVPSPSPHPHQAETEPRIGGILVTMTIQTCSQSLLISNGANEKFLWSRSLWSWWQSCGSERQVARRWKCGLILWHHHKTSSYMGAYVVMSPLNSQTSGKRDENEKIG